MHLGTYPGLPAQRIFRIEGGLEIQESAFFLVTCRRVFFDEVLAVTLHHALGWPLLLGVGALAGWLSLGALLLGIGGSKVAGLILFALTGLPLLGLFVLRLTLGVDIVSVYGKRTHARMQFFLPRGRGREVYLQVAGLVRDAQRRARGVPAADAPPA